MNEQATATVDRIERADARRNRERVLDAARAAFAEDGIEAQMPEIARRAGVGVGTVYRRFPTKQALLDALADDHFERLRSLAEDRLESDEGPWSAFEGFMQDAARIVSEDRGMAQVTAAHPELMRAEREAKAQLAATVSQLMDRAKAAGDMRSDASFADIPTIMCGLCHVAATAHGGASELSWQRYLGLMLDGLRAT